MKKVIALSALLIAVAVGCSSQADTQSSTSTTFKKSTTTKPSQSSLVDSFVGAMSEEFPGATRSEYISLGKTACDALDRVGSIDGVLTEIVIDPTISSSEAGDLGFIIGVAIPAFCPEYTAELDSFR
jgi:hypothetical protein